MALLTLSLWNLIVVPIWLLGIFVTHVRLRRWWATLCAALVAWTVDGLLVPLGAATLGLVSLLFAERVSAYLGRPRQS
jgi:hypothetical protein